MDIKVARLKQDKTFQIIGEIIEDDQVTISSLTKEGNFITNELIETDEFNISQTGLKVFEIEEGANITS